MYRIIDMKKTFLLKYLKHKLLTTKHHYSGIGKKVLIADFLCKYWNCYTNTHSSISYNCLHNCTAVPVFILIIFLYFWSKTISKI